jgi:hypothetical protein
MRPSATVLAALATFVAISPLDAQWRGDEVIAERAGSASAVGASAVRVEARAGSLRVEGRAGLTEVRARGTARAGSRSVLEAIRLHVTRSGTTVDVRVETPDNRGDDDWAALDLVVELPATVDLRVDDGSGDLEVKGVKSLDLVDGSGEIRLDDVRGDVRLEDGSGSIELHNVRGSVTVDDGSGSLDATDVGGTLRVGSKGSGSIDVSRIGGDFIVARRSSGSVDYHDVKGRVDVPERRRSRGKGW